MPGAFQPLALLFAFLLHRGIWADGWKATTYHEAGQPFESDQWGLFHLDEDFSECHDLAAEHPEKLQELIGRRDKLARRFKGAPWSLVSSLVR